MVVLILATRNRHKAGEIQSILGAGFVCRTLEDFPGAPALVEDAATFAGNAARKAGQLAAWLEAQRRPDPAKASRTYVLADDSGLEVDALQGAPGVQSARFAALDRGLEGNAPDVANNAKLLRLLQDVPRTDRTARFRCVLALRPVGVAGADSELFEGVCEGRIQSAPTGKGGFGYDPLFVPAGYDLSFAELGEAVKNRISHRARALARLRDRLAPMAPAEKA